MADATVTTPPPAKRRRWLRVLGWIVGIFIVLLVVVYFVGTSSAFFKGVILPKASAALDAKITVSDASISPFKQVVLRDLKVQTTGAEPLVTAPEVRLRYSLMDIMRGNIKVDEVSLSSPTITVVENPDKTSNLDPLLKSSKEKPSKPAQPSQPSKPMRLDIKKVVLNNGTIRQVKLYPGGKRDLTELSNVNLTLDDLKNGQTGKLALGADIKLDNNPPAPGTNANLEAKLNGNFNLAPTENLQAATVQGNLRLDVTQAGGALAQVAALNANLDCNITPTEIKQLALRFQKAQAPLGELRVSGPFDAAKSEGKLSVEVLNLDKNVLNLAGASSGLDFGPTTINATNQIELAKAGQSVSAKGQLNLNKLQITRAGQTTPPLDLRADYDVNLDKAANTALLRAFTLKGVQNGNQVVHGELTSPMPIALGQTSNAVGEAALNLAVSHLQLADWKAFVGQIAPAGDVNLKLQLLSQQGGQQLTFDLNSEIGDLTVISGTNQYTGVAITLNGHGQAAELNRFAFPDYRLQLARQNLPLVTISGSATYDKTNEAADAQLNGQLMLANLTRAFPEPDIAVSSGMANLKAHVSQKQKKQTVSGTFSMVDFTGKVGSNSFKSFGATADLEVAMTPEQIEIRKITGQLLEGQTAGGTFNLTGALNPTNKAARLNATLAQFNQAGLRPFLEPMLADKKLVSVALNGNAAVQYDPQAASDVKADLQVTNLVVNDPKGQFPATPLSARMQLGASLRNQITELRQASLALTPTALGSNVVQLTGRIDMSRTNVIAGNLKLAADSLDLTSYYDLFAGKTAGPEKSPAATAPQPAPVLTPTGPEKSSAPNTSFANFVAEAMIGAIYLHEVQITNLQTTAKLDGQRVLLNPCKLSLNGAPVNTTVDLDLGVPGYKYDIAANAMAIPLAPLVNTFQPERKGEIGGTLTAGAKITGIGTSGAELKKNLAGNFDVATTNMNLAVTKIRSPILKTLVNVIALIPDLVRNPDNALGSLVGALVPQRGAGQTGGLAGELEKSPIDKINLRGTMGSGKVILQQAMVQSPAFEADATGTVQLEDVLTNSEINVPVTISLGQSVAQRINLAPANAATNTGYAKLPDFLTLAGTVGKPKEQINKIKLLGLAARGVSGVPGIGGPAGGILQGVGNLLGGNTSSGTNAPASTNRQGNNLLQGLGGLLGHPAGTNTNTNAPATNQSPVGNLLNNLLGPRK